MNDLVEGCVITGKVALDGEDIYGDMETQSLDMLYRKFCCVYGG